MTKEIGTERARECKEREKRAGKKMEPFAGACSLITVKSQCRRRVA